MAKHLNERHEAILLSKCKVLVPIKDLKDGDIVPHSIYVEEVNIYRYDSYKDAHQKVILSRQFLEDIMNQIKEIEAEEQNMPYDTLPF